MIRSRTVHRCGHPWQHNFGRLLFILGWIYLALDIGFPLIIDWANQATGGYAFLAFYGYSFLLLFGLIPLGVGFLYGLFSGRCTREPVQPCHCAHCQEMRQWHSVPSILQR